MPEWCRSGTARHCVVSYYFGCRPSVATQRQSGQTCNTLTVTVIAHSAIFQTLQSSMPVSAVDSNLSELDTLLADLNNARYAAENNNIQAEGGRSTVSNSNYAYGDYYSDLDSSIDDKPPSR